MLTYGRENRKPTSAGWSATVARRGLGDDPLDVGPVFTVVLTQPGPGGPVAAGGAQQRVAGA